MKSVPAGRGERVEDKRPYTHRKNCPRCDAVIEFWWTSGMSQCYPHFYCEACGSPIHRAKDQETLRGIADEAELIAAARRIEADLPRCLCGGRYRLNAGPRCPSCGVDFPHGGEAKARILDPNIILVTGATFVYLPEDGKGG